MLTITAHQFYPTISPDNYSIFLPYASNMLLLGILLHCQYYYSIYPIVQLLLILITHIELAISTKHKVVVKVYPVSRSLILEMAVMAILCLNLGVFILTSLRPPKKCVVRCSNTSHLQVG